MGPSLQKGSNSTGSSEGPPRRNREAVFLSRMNACALGAARNPWAGINTFRRLQAPMPVTDRKENTRYSSVDVPTRANYRLPCREAAVADILDAAGLMLR